MFNIADEKEIDFYCKFDIAPLGMLSECMYDNEFRLGVSYGDDVCLHLENTEKSSCKDCKNGQGTKLYYPVITDFIIINFLLICGVDDTLKTYYSTEDRNKILNYVLEKANNQEIKQKIRKLLIGHLQEYSKK